MFPHSGWFILATLIVGLLALHLYRIPNKKLLWPESEEIDETIIKLSKKTGIKLKIYQINGMLRKDWLSYGLMALILFASLFFMLNHLGQFMSVDEPKWFYIRVPQFIKSLISMQFSGTFINDKPGVLPAVLSTPFLLIFNPYGVSYANIEDALFLWRLPIVLFNIAALLVIFILLKDLFGNNFALLCVSFIALNPIIIGISQIVNPDSTLWSTGLISLLFFGKYLKTNSDKHLYLSAFFMGMALLSKYFASIMYLVFFASILIEFLFDKNSSIEKLKIRILDYFILIGISILMYSLLFPATWVLPEQIFKGTLFAKILKPGYPLFAVAVLIIFSDILILKGEMLNSVKRRGLLNKAYRALSAISLIYTIILLLNLFAGYSYFDLNNFISAYHTMWDVGLSKLDFLIGNSYFTILTLNPIILFGFIVFLALIIIDKSRLSFANSLTEVVMLFTCLTFIFIYIIGSALGEYLAIARYQILLYPLIAILSTSAINYLAGPRARIIVIIVIILNIYILSNSYPFYLHYTNPLNLQDEVITDAWGFGGYEVAQIANNLTNAEFLNIWADREGFREFFKGNTLGRSISPFYLRDLDYLVLTSGGKNIFKRNQWLSEKQAANVNDFYAKYEDRLLEYYDSEPEAEVLIHGNPNNYVRLVKFRPLNSSIT